MPHERREQTLNGKHTQGCTNAGAGVSTREHLDGGVVKLLRYWVMAIYLPGQVE